MHLNIISVWAISFTNYYKFLFTCSFIPITRYLKVFFTCSFVFYLFTKVYILEDFTLLSQIPQWIFFFFLYSSNFKGQTLHFWHSITCWKFFWLRFFLYANQNIFFIFISQNFFLYSIKSFYIIMFGSIRLWNYYFTKFSELNSIIVKPEILLPNF